MNREIELTRTDAERILAEGRVENQSWCGANDFCFGPLKEIKEQIIEAEELEDEPKCAQNKYLKNLAEEHNLKTNYDWSGYLSEISGLYYYRNEKDLVKTLLDNNFDSELTEKELSAELRRFYPGEKYTTFIIDDVICSY